MNQQPSSTLLLIRLWADDASSAKWQGRIQTIGAGRASSFSDWPTLHQLLEEVLLTPAGPDAPDGSNQATRGDTLSSFELSPLQ